MLLFELSQLLLDNDLVNRLANFVFDWADIGAILVGSITSYVLILLIRRVI